MRRNEAGFTLIEALLSVSLMLVVATGLAGMLIHNAELNSSQQMTAHAQTNARTAVSLLVQRLRSAGWDPVNAGFPAVVLDPLNNDANEADGVDNLVVFADINGDGEVDGTVTDDDDGELLLIRHDGDRIEWRMKGSASYITLIDHVSNDADGDGTTEPMFIPDDATDPSRITIRVTARSPSPDPVSGEFIRYTVTSDVVLRKTL